MNPSRASIRFLAEAFAVWCDQKSRLAAARATGLLDDESHDALADAYARTRELIGALLAQAPEVSREARADSDYAVPRTEILGGPASGGPQPGERIAAGRRACPAC